MRSVPEVGEGEVKATRTKGKGPRVGMVAARWCRRLRTARTPRNVSGRCRGFEHLPVREQLLLELCTCQLMPRSAGLIAHYRHNTSMCSGSPWPAWCSAPLLPFSLLGSLPLFQQRPRVNESQSVTIFILTRVNIPLLLAEFQAERRGGERDVLCSVSGRGRRARL